MILNYQNLKKKYINLFENEDKCDSVLTDVLFAFNELFPIIKNDNVKRVLEIGSGTSILLNELSRIFPEKIFVGVDPHDSGFDNFESISKKMILNKNMRVFHEDFTKFNQEKDFDLIYSFNVFEHLSDQNKYLDIMNKLLSLNGKSVIFCPNYDFPYEPHFVIPIIYNKELTYKIFKKRIDKHEKTSGGTGLWNGLNLCSKKKIKKYLVKNNYKFEFDNEIKNRLFRRFDDDQSKYFKKRQLLVAKITKIAKLFYLDKFIFDILKIPFPYMKIIINKNLDSNDK